MRSQKRPSTSKSGASRKSTKSTERSTNTESSSRIAPASFDQVFGETKTTSPEQERYGRLFRAAEERLQALTGAPMPQNGLLKARHKQRIARERKALRDLAELLD